MVQLDVESVLSQAWDLTKKHWLGFSLLVIVYLIISYVISVIINLLIPGAPGMSDAIAVMQASINGDKAAAQALTAATEAYQFSAGWWIEQIVSAIVSMIFSAVLGRLMLDVVRGHLDSLSVDAVMEALCQPVGFYVLYCALGLVSGVGALIGFGLCVVPGLIFCAMLFCVGYLCIDNPNLPFFDYFRRAYELTRGNLMSIILIFLACILIVCVGFACCCIGVLPASVMCEFAAAVAYVTLLSGKKEVDY